VLDKLFALRRCAEDARGLTQRRYDAKLLQLNRRSPAMRLGPERAAEGKRPRICPASPGLWKLGGQGLSSGVIEQRDIAVWAASALLAIGIGWSRYAKAKSRNDLLRQLAAMDPERRRKMLSRFNPRMAMELRQELLERFRIMC
jgi:hypothetical protein